MTLCTLIEQSFFINIYIYLYGKVGTDFISCIYILLYPEGVLEKLLSVFLSFRCKCS